MSALLSIEGVSTRFGAYQALDRIDLAINQGEFVALLAPAAAARPRCCARSPVSSRRMPAAS